MKKLSTIYLSLLLATAVAIGFSSCKKENLNDTPESELLASAIQVISATPSSDAVYIVNVCQRGGSKDSVAFSTLPAAVPTYLTANYAGYTVQKSFKITNPSGSVEGYAVVILFNGKPVGLKFDTAGTFLKVFEQRERGDMKGQGWHHGGRFDCRDGQHRDSVAISLLPAAVKTYYATNYPADTLIHAVSNKDGSFVVISANKGLYASVFSSTGTFIKREALPVRPGKPAAVSQTDLPSKAVSYLASTFPGYAVNKAFAFKVNSAVQGYLVIIDVNGTKHAIQFDASGNFIKNVAVR